MLRLEANGSDIEITHRYATVEERGGVDVEGKGRRMEAEEGNLNSQLTKCVEDLSQQKKLRGYIQEDRMQLSVC